MTTTEPASELDAREPITHEELALAARNHGMPLEGLRYDVTPIGMHYLLIHFDIPAADADTWSVDVGGLVSRPLSLSIADLRARPAVTTTVTMECAGNGRARMEPRPLSQPWLDEAIGTATWTGTPLAPILEEAGLASEAVEVVFTGADHGEQGEVEQDYARSLSIADAMRDEVVLAYELNGQPLPPQHGFPIRLIVPGWYGMTSVKWLRSITAVAQPFDGYQMWAYRLRQHEEDEGTPVTRMMPRALMIPPGFPDFFTRSRTVEAGAVTLEGRAWSGLGERLAGRGQRGRRRVLGRGAALGTARRARVARMDVRVDGRVRRARADGSRGGRRRQRPAVGTTLERARLLEQPRAAGPGAGQVASPAT